MMDSRKQRVAVLGASAERSKFGNKSLRAHRQAGWEVVPVNPRGGEIEGERVAVDLAAIVDPVDRVTVYLPPPTTLAALPAIAEHQPQAEVWFNPGSSDARVRAEAERLGLRTVSACSIVDLGLSPSQFP